MSTAWRIGDRERERAEGRLADHYAEGRLSPDEHAERLDAVWSARTEADLVVLFGDLPEPVAARPLPAPRRSSARWSRPPLVPLAVLLVVAALVAGPPVLLVLLVVGVLMTGRGCRARA